MRTPRQVRPFKIKGLVEVLSEGNYAKIPPSIHGMNVDYRFVNDVREPQLFSDIEQFVWKRAEELGYKKSKVKDIGAPRTVKGSGYLPNCVSTLAQGVEEGSRNNDALHLATYWLNVRQLRPEETRTWLQEWNAKNDPPLDNRELDAVLESAHRGGYTYHCCLRTSEAGNRPDEAAEYVLSEMKIKTLSDTKEMLFWNSSWHFGGETKIEKLVQEKFHAAQLDHVATNHFITEVLGHLRRRTYVDRKEFDADPSILVLKNCVLDLRDFTVKEHSPEYLTIGQLPVEYRPDAKCPRWEEFVGQAMRKEDIPASQEFSGSILEKNYKHQTAWMLLGTGLNGKGTFARVLTMVIGPENVSAVSLQELQSNKFARANLYGKLANIYPDIGSGALKATDVFKAATGEGLITAEKKNKDPFQFENHAKLVYSANQLPRTPDNTPAFYRRWLITSFPNTFKLDPEFEARLKTPEELSGVLNWMVEGLKRLRSQKYQLSNSKSMEQLRDEYTRNSDPIKAFLNECCVPDPEQAIVKELLYSAYKKYCEQHRLIVATHDEFCKILPRKADYQIRTARLRVGGVRVPSFEGLWLRQPKSWGADVEEDEKPVVEQTSLRSDRLEEGGPPGTPGPIVPPVPPVPGSSYQAQTQSGEPELKLPFVEVGQCTRCGKSGVPLRPDIRGQWGQCGPCYDELSKRDP